MNILKWAVTGALVLAVGFASSIGVMSAMTERDIRDLQQQVASISAETAFVMPSSSDLASLPAPVQRFVAFTFPAGIRGAQLVRLTSEGQFRRPQTENFNFTTSEQVIALTEPALMFSATTPIITGVWARAYDFFADGEMEMKAKILSAITVVDESETPALNVISLRRWLLESALYPQALLPGGPVTWEPIDENSARAIVSASGMQSAMTVYFDDRGAITYMVAEEDGDLSTPYHGSGEHVTRSDYREVDGVMIPHAFIISRMSGGEVFPFFNANLTSVGFE